MDITIKFNFVSKIKLQPNIGKIKKDYYGLNGGHIILVFQNGLSYCIIEIATKIQNGE